MHNKNALILPAPQLCYLPVKIVSSIIFRFLIYSGRMNNLLTEIPLQTKEGVPKPHTFPLRRGRDSPAYYPTTFEKFYEEQKLQFKQEQKQIGRLQKEIAQQVRESAPPVTHVVGTALEIAESFNILTIVPHLGVVISVLGT